MARLPSLGRRIRPRRWTYSRREALPARMTATPASGNVDPFVQDVGGDDGAVAALPEAVQDLLALAGRRLVGYAGDEEPPAERVDLIDALGEDDDAVVPVLPEERLQRHALPHGALPDLTPPPRREQRLPAPRVAGGGDHDEALPVLGRAHRQPMLLQEVPVDGLGLGVIEAFLGRQLDGYAHQFEGGEVGPRQILGRAPVDDRPRQARAGARGRRRAAPAWP